MPETLPSISATEALLRLSTGRIRLLDLRKAEARAASGLTVRGAIWRDPFRLPDDSAIVEDKTPAIVFCVHGHEVSQFGAAWLLLHGIDAVYVRGGFEALRAANAPLSEIDA